MQWMNVLAGVVGQSKRAGRSSRRWSQINAGESLEQRLLLTDVTASITTDTVWDNTSEPYILRNRIYVANGATLDIRPGVTVIESSAQNDLYVQNGGHLIADGAILDTSLLVSQNGTEATFEITNTELGDGLQLYALASGTITGGVYSGPYFDINPAADVTMSGVNFTTLPTMAISPEFLPQLRNNTLLSGQTVQLAGATITDAADWRIPEIVQFTLNGRITIDIGGTLDIGEATVRASTQNNFGHIYVTNGGVLNAEGTTFRDMQVNVGTEGTGILNANNVNFAGGLSVHPLGEAHLTDAEFSGTFLEIRPGAEFEADGFEFTSRPTIYTPIEQVPAFRDYELMTGTTLLVFGGNLFDDADWDIPNVSRFGLAGAINIQGPATLTLPKTVVYQASTGPGEFRVINGGTLVSDGTVFNAAVHVGREGTGTIISRNSEFNSIFYFGAESQGQIALSDLNNQLYLTAGTTVDFYLNDLDDAIRVQAEGNAASGPIDLSQNYWGTTNTAAIDFLIRDQNDEANRPLIDYTPILTEPPLTELFLVTNLNNTGAGSIRSAVNYANRILGHDTIEFAPGLQGTITLKESGNLTLTDDLTLVGPAVAHSIILQGSETPFDYVRRIFSVTEGVYFELSNLVLQNARVLEENLSGAAIRNLGDLVVDNCIFLNNQAQLGGAIGADSPNITASITIRNSFFQGNTAGYLGGAIYSRGRDRTQITIENTTFYENNSDLAGAIYLDASYTEIFNSTISGNSATSHGGGIRVIGGGNLRIANSTIVNNIANSDDFGDGTGGGISDPSTVVEIRNSILMNNVRTTDRIVDDYSGILNESIANIIGDPAVAGQISVGSDNIFGIPITDVIDPILRDNGGGQWTHALIPGSPALNAGRNEYAVDGDENPLLYDQRGEGYPRILGGTVDIGAVEGAVYTLSSIAGYENGNWWVTAPGGNGGYVTMLWADWPTDELIEVLHGDFNGDGLDDIAAWLPNGEWRIGLAQSNGSFTFELWTTWRTTGIKEFHVGDFNHDGRDDIIALFQTGDSGAWWVAQSTGSGFVNRHWGTYGKYEGILDVLVGNFDGVNGDDLAIIATSGVVWIAKTSNSQFQYLQSHRWNVASGFNFAQVGDFNGDNLDDLVAVFGNSTNRYVFVGESRGPAVGFDSVQYARLTVTQSFDSLLVGDFNGDGVDDVAARLNTTKWWVGLANVARFDFSLWTTWAFATNGVFDLHVGSSNGDPFDDIFGRDNNGNWYSAESDSSRFANRVIATWPQADWEYVQVGKFWSPPAGSMSTESHSPQSFEDFEEFELDRLWLSE